jgi:hypothetical protein
MLISVQELRNHLNLELGEEEDLFLENKLAAAEQSIGKFMGVDLEVTYYVPDSCVAGEEEGEFECPAPPAGKALLPAPLREAILQLAAHFYENREPVLVGAGAQALPYNVFDLVGPYRNWSF